MSLNSLFLQHQTGLTMNSILEHIKFMLGISVDDNSFDYEIIAHINNALFTLRQIGVNTVTEFCVNDSSSTWSDFTNNTSIHGPVKTYVYTKVKIIFDPPPTSALLQSLESLSKEALWRIQEEIEIQNTFNGEEIQNGGNNA